MNPRKFKDKTINTIVIKVMDMKTPSEANLKINRSFNDKSYSAWPVTGDMCFSIPLLETIY